GRCEAVVRAVALDLDAAQLRVLFEERRQLLHREQALPRQLGRAAREHDRRAQLQALARDPDAGLRGHRRQYEPLIELLQRLDVDARDALQVPRRLNRDERDAWRYVLEAEGADFVRLQLELATEH